MNAKKFLMIFWTRVWRLTSENCWSVLKRMVWNVGKIDCTLIFFLCEWYQSLSKKLQGCGSVAERAHGLTHWKCVENLKNNPMGINEWLEGYLKWLIWTEIFHSISFTTLGWALIHTSFRALVQTLNIDNRWKSHSWRGTSWEITPGPRRSVKHENNSYLKLKWCVVHYSGNSHTAGQSHVR